MQDVVIGLTLIFTDALNIGEMVKLGDEIGKVDSIGLRYTALIKRRYCKRFRQLARACRANTDLSFWPCRKSSE
ncbi:MAG: mechanosensitive ion channel domain-containing protein [Desulfobacterales bacterium]